MYNIFIVFCVFDQLLNPLHSRSPDELGPVYSIEQQEERESSETSGKELEEMKPGPVKTEIADSLSQYDLSSYPSELSASLKKYLQNSKHCCSVFSLMS